MVFLVGPVINQALAIHHLTMKKRPKRLEIKKSTRDKKKAKRKEERILSQATKIEYLESYGSNLLILVLSLFLCFFFNSELCFVPLLRV